MFDAHYDLLTLAYVSYLKDDYTYLEQFMKNFNSQNVTGLIANLYFMSQQEMNQELSKYYFQKGTSVLSMFKIAKSIVQKYLPQDIQMIYSVEGCDYIQDEEELEALYQEGLRSLILTWNEQNKYGSGNRSRNGLTDLGRSFLKKAIALGIGIDLSHANSQTFQDMIDLIKIEQARDREVVCYASHSNARKLCDHERNLTDDQLRELKEVGGLVGIVSYRPFVTSKNNLLSSQYQKDYLDHLLHVRSILGKTKVMVSTDDMTFDQSNVREHLTGALFPYSTIKQDLLKLLKTKLTEEEAQQILFHNAEQSLLNPLLNKKEGRSYVRY